MSDSQFVDVYAAMVNRHPRPVNPLPAPSLDVEVAVGFEGAYQFIPVGVAVRVG